MRLYLYLWYAQEATSQYLRALFGQKENFTVYFSRKRRLLLHPNTAQRSFFPLQSFSRKTLRRLARKARVNKERVYRIVHMAPGYPKNEYSLNLINSIWPPAVAVKSSIRKSRENAACWMPVIFFWHVIDQSEEYREIGRGGNLFVQVPVCNTTQIKRLRGIHHIVAASGNNTTISVDIFFWLFRSTNDNFMIACNEISIAHVFSLPLF